MLKLLQILVRLFAPSCAIILCATSVWAVPLAEYKQNVQRAASLLDELQSSELEGRTVNRPVLLREIRKLLPVSQKIESGTGTGDFEINNSWLETSLKNYETAPRSATAQRAQILQEASERVRAIEDRLDELAAAQVSAKTNNDKQKLDEILRRPEFQKPPAEKEKSVLENWLAALEKWFRSFRREPAAVEQKPQVDLSPLGVILNYVVIALAVAIIGFVVWRFLLPLMGNVRGRKKPKKKEPRVILGEQIAPDATATDLLTQADRLAAAGEHRQAIRKGYIAALCDLSDRKVLGLARHKTNRDYLRDVRKRQEIYQPMNGMTGIFERHWYGDVPAEQEDWQTFRGQLSAVSHQLSKN